MRAYLQCLLLLTFAGVLTAQQQPPVPATSTPSSTEAISAADQQTDANVVTALGSAKSLSNVAITTNTQNGIVTLSGIVRSDSQKELAEVLAAHADGVKRVVNSLQVGAEQASCDPAKEQLLSDGTCAPLEAPQPDSPPQPAPPPPAPPRPIPTGPTVQVDVDQNCRVLELGANGKEANKQRYRYDPLACNLRGPKYVQTYVDRIDDSGKMRRIAADIVEETFEMHNGTNSTIMYMVHVPLRKGWFFDSQPKPALIESNVGVWRVIVQPGETIRLSTGQRRER
jgi:hypothetical protein